jgi:hypothetical protein
LKADTPDFTDQPVTRLTTDRTVPTTSNARNWYRTRSNGKGGPRPRSSVHRPRLPSFSS